MPWPTHKIEVVWKLIDGLEDDQTRRATAVGKIRVRATAEGRCTARGATNISNEEQPTKTRPQRSEMQETYPGPQPESQPNQQSESKPDTKGTEQTEEARLEQEQQQQMEEEPLEPLDQSILDYSMKINGVQSWVRCAMHYSTAMLCVGPSSTIQRSNVNRDKAE